MAIAPVDAGGLVAMDGRATPPAHVLSITDLEGHLDLLINEAIELKAQAARGKLPQPLAGKTVVTIFEKNSTRTRISFDVGIQRLGGISTILDQGTSQLARGETIEDTGAVLSRYADALVYRTASHQNLVDLAKAATVPVVNALTDLEHPCQVLADLTTLQEHLTNTGKGHLKGKRLAYVGDGNNMCHAYLLGCAIAGMEIRVATPPGYGPEGSVVKEAEQLAKAHGGSVLVTHDPQEAVAGAHAVATDTWVSMGDEVEAAERLAAFDGYTVDEALMEQAGEGAVFLHCLPGHWGHEATYAVAHGPRSLILEEAENRMWSQMALLAYLV